MIQTIFTARNIQGQFCTAYFSQLGPPISNLGNIYSDTRFAFLSPLLGRLRATYDVHLRLIGKRVVFILVLIELFR